MIPKGDIKFFKRESNKISGQIHEESCYNLACDQEIVENQEEDKEDIDIDNFIQNDQQESQNSNCMSGEEEIATVINKINSRKQRRMLRQGATQD
jgi:hypothetical protein